MCVCVFFNWSFHLCIVRNGHIKRITDQDIQSSVLEVMGTNVSTTFLTCPANPKQTLGIKLPFLVMIIKNVSSLFLFLFLSFSLHSFSFFLSLSPFFLLSPVIIFLINPPFTVEKILYI